MRLDPLRTGFALGSIFGLWHLAWATLVAVGAARWLLDLVLWLHFLNLPIGLAPFDLGRAALLVAFTAAVGGVMGALFAVVWNRLHPAAAAAVQGEFLGVVSVDTRRTPDRA